MSEELSEEQKKLLEKLKSDKKILTELLQSKGKDYQTFSQGIKKK